MSGDDAAAKNRDAWNRSSDEYQDRHGAGLERTARAWGTWRIAEDELGALGEVAGRDVLELGCGAAQWSLALAAEGARVVGLDLSERQLAHARRRALDSTMTLPLVQAGAERLPFAATSFDLVFCDHGAMSFADPRRTVPEVARVLRPGGGFVFCMSTPLRDLTIGPGSDLPTGRLERSYFDELECPDDDGEVLWQLPYGDWVRLFRRNGLAIEDLIELRPPPGATTSYDDYVSLDWSRRWPSDHIWKLARVAG